MSACSTRPPQVPIPARDRSAAHGPASATVAVTRFIFKAKKSTRFFFFCFLLSADVVSF